MAIQLAYAFDENTGSTTADASGNNRTGNLIGSPAWMAIGKYGSAIDYDGSNDCVVFPTIGGGLFNGSSSFTVTFWIKPVAGSLILETAQVYWHCRAEFDIAIRYVSSTRQFDMTWFDGSEHSTFSSETMTADTWFHVAGVWNAGTTTATIFVNASSTNTTTTATGSPNTTTGDNTIGGRRVTSGGAVDQPWLGGIDNLRIYDTVLDGAAITTDMNTAIGGGEPPATDFGGPSVTLYRVGLRRY